MSQVINGSYGFSFKSKIQGTSIFPLWVGEFSKERDLCCFNGIIYRKEDYTSGNGPWRYEQNLSTTLFLTYILSIIVPTDLGVMLPLEH